MSEGFSLNINGIESMKLCACGHEAYHHILLGPCTVNQGLAEATKCSCRQYTFEMKYLEDE